MIDEFKIYSISDRYINFLKQRIPHVYSNKESQRIHTRKYIGVALRIDDFCYYIPMSSPKESDYQIIGHNKVIRKSIIPIIRIIVKNSKGIKELKGTLRISHMIPVPEIELELYDIDSETDLSYRDLVQDEIIFIRKHKNKIANNAKVLYKQKLSGDTSAGYVKAALNYKELEKLCKEFSSQE